MEIEGCSDIWTQTFGGNHVMQGTNSDVILDLFCFPFISIFPSEFSKMITFKAHQRNTVFMLGQHA